ncbi:IclR family transcriptional regulator [Pseudorhodoferax sp. Leaf267]|uniref:IclR family transcriptional regulator n=1 Tax=Pseudorhodoferax sp. Leaf267 TaxID=1736316 RepID=UPI0006F3F33E|nr:IclR family transcriptional regulator [Pseudorhodoferax sp. Leaf267]KQP22461.1 IclR family transcriptional regulator [Pseudorhodoferax sp. Leaf267]
MTPAHPSFDEADTPQVAGTQAFGKFMRVLQLVADAEQAPNVAVLAQATGFPRPTVHRIVAGLVAERMLVEDPHTHLLSLGPRLIQLASRSWGRSDLRLAAMDELKRLRDVTGETVHLAVPNGQGMVFIEKLESPSAVRMSSRIGTSVPLHVTAVGKAWLAALDPTAQAAVLKNLPLPRHTEHTLTDRAAFQRELAATRAQGWSTDREEHEAGVYCFGAVVRGANGAPVAAISVTTLLFRQKEDPEQAYVAPLLAACAAVSARIAEVPSLSVADTL